MGQQAFNGTTGLKTVDFSKNTVLQTVAGSAFMNSGVTNLDLSKATKLITIQPASFQGCASLSTIALPNSLTSIGDRAFLASGLTSLDLSNTQVTTIGQGAFANTAKLESLKVPSTLATLNSGSSTSGDPVTATFSGSGITELDLSNTKITQIAESTFSGATKLASVTLPAGLTSIGSSAFQNATSLSTITLPNSLTTIGNNAFQGSGLTSIDLSQTKINAIPNDAFNWVAKLATVNLPATVTTIGNNAFNSASALQTLTQVAPATPGRGNGQRTLAKAGENKLSSSITSIGDRAFASTGLTSIDLSETSITGRDGHTLGSNAFQNASSLATVKLPTNLTSFGDGAFRSTALSTLDLKDTKITAIPSDAFNGVASLASVTLPAGVTSIGDRAFLASGLTSLDLSNTQVTTIGQGAFTNTTALKTLTVPNTLTTLNSTGNGSYGDDTSATFFGSALESLDLSSTQITSIADYTFSGAAKLATVNLPAGVTSIGNKAFYGTTVLKTLTQGDKSQNNNKLNDKITTIGNYAFAKTGLENINLSGTKILGEGSGTSLGNSVFLQATSLNSLTLPSGLQTIPAGMVAGDTALTTLTIPTTVTKINGGNGDFPGAFAGSGLTSIDLSVATGLTTWQPSNGGSGTLQGADKLTSVKLPFSIAGGTTNSQNSGIARDSFNGCTQLNTIEFVLNNVSDLSTLGTGTDATNNTTALTNIYKMFAASEDNFSNNGSLNGTNTTLASDKAWLPTTETLNSQTNFNAKAKAYHVNFNGIKWESKVAAPVGVEFIAPTNGEAKFDPGKDWTNVTTLEITGTVTNNGGFKYKYTNSQGNVSLNANNNDSQTLPSNIKTIKITLKKAGSK